MNSIINKYDYKAYVWTHIFSNCRLYAKTMFFKIQFFKIIFYNGIEYLNFSD